MTDNAECVAPFKCPRCDGQGHTGRPPWVPGDQSTWSSTTAVSHPCPPCSGTGIIWRAALTDGSQEGYNRETGAITKKEGSDE